MLVNFFKKPMGMATLVAAAAGGPYVFYETDAGKRARDVFTSVTSSVSSDGSSMLGSSSGAGIEDRDTNGVPKGFLVSSNHVGPAKAVSGGTPALWNYATGVPTLEQLQSASDAQPVVGGPVKDLRDILRFDINPGWVPQNFARVSTVLADVQLDGLRVPVVTGTKQSDLAATITYYFDNQQTLRRINVQGLTGDPSGIANLMQQYYGLKPEASLGGHLYTTRWNNRVTSMLHVAPAPIMYANAVNSNYVVFLELNQPSLPYGLSQEANDVLLTGHQAARW